MSTPTPEIPPDAAGSAAESTGSDAPTRAGSSGSGSSSSSGSGTPAFTGTWAAPDADAIPGYRLHDEIHRGGQGIVYRATQLGTKRDVALKVLLEGPLASESARRRFEREIELAASFQHPNIVSILDSGLSRGRYYFAMEYVDGVRLDRYLAQRRPSLHQAVELLATVCDAVNYAHQRGVIHRDLKPANILVTADGQPHVLDLGLAKPVQTPTARDSTVRVLSTSGQLLGTVAYMSPEQATGAQDVDVRADVYALGVIFYEALVGQPPYPVDGPLGNVLRHVAQTDAAAPRAVARSYAHYYRVDDELATILLKTLEKSRERRYQTAGDLARDLRHWVHGEPIEAKRASGLYMLRKTIGRYRWQAASVGVLALAVIGFTVALVVLFTREREARGRAVAKTEEARQAVLRQEQALQEARDRTAEAILAQQQLRQALVREHLQRGDLAMDQLDFPEARNSFWRAADVAPSPAVSWALRRYYMQAPDCQSAILTAGPTHGPSGLSPDRGLAAVCSTPGGITVRDLNAGAERRWVSVPGPVGAVDVCDDGSLAALGDGWARAWTATGHVPSVAVELPRGGSSGDIFAMDGGTRLMLVAGRRVRTFAGPGGEQVTGALLKGSRSGLADYDRRRRLLAVPTSAGVELVHVQPDGQLQGEIVWTGNTPPAAARFDAGGALAVLADAIYVAPSDSLEAGPWTLLSPSVPGWDVFDFDLATNVIAFGTRDGRVAFHTGDALRGTWRCAAQRLDQLRVVPGGEAMITLDAAGVASRWMLPGHGQEAQLVHPASPVEWAVSPDGSLALLALERGEVLAYHAGPPAQVERLLRPRMLTFAADIALATDAAGSRALLRDQSTLRLLDLSTGTRRLLRWRHETLGVMGPVALSADGQLLAMLVRSATGHLQKVVLRDWNTLEAPDPHTTAEDDQLAGALARTMVFEPGGHRLLLARSSGDLAHLDPDDNPRAGAGPRRPIHWMSLDYPAYLLAFSSDGGYLAAACDDQMVRVVDVARASVKRRIAVRDKVRAMTFNPRDDLLLVRLADGHVNLFDPETGQRLAQWHVPTGGGAMAAWLGGTSDALLLERDGALYAYRFAQADEMIDQNRAFALERTAAEYLDAEDWSSAWVRATELSQRDPGRGRALLAAILEAALAQPDSPLPESWLDAFETASATTWMRLGQAAYRGERFEIALTLLERAQRAAAPDGLDAQSLWQIACCEYLLGAYDASAAHLADVLDSRDLGSGARPQAGLQQVASLVLANRMEDARAAARRVDELASRVTFDELVGASFANAIARHLAGLERDSTVAAVFDRLLVNFGERSLDYRDDAHFFLGELARMRGDFDAAVEQYQRCIDLARDVWPANWARFRLSHDVPGEDHAVGVANGKENG